MEFTVTPKEECVIVNLIGLINEDADITFQNLLTLISEYKKIYFNFSQVKSINSLGVRSWVTFLRMIEAEREIIFQECTPDVIMQINMIPSFLGKALVETFYVRYVCEVCEKETENLLYVNQLQTKTIPLNPKCDAPDCAMQTEELEEEYFAFLLR
ncbi:MAG: hypothetical protein K2X39_02655 [Silvanigrellaceae bacterium]|nr:hypothetical protein [Silvanigrellaceae bacterium]